MQALQQYIGGQKDWAGVVAEREEVSRLVKRDSFFPVQISGQFRSHGIAAEKPQQKAVGAGGGESQEFLEKRPEREQDFFCGSRADY